MAKLIELRFRAVDHAHVADAHAALSSLPAHGAPRRFLGKEWDVEEERHVVSDEPAVLRLSPVELAQLRKHYAECVADGHLVCCDAATASALGVPFHPSFEG